MNWEAIKDAVGTFFSQPVPIIGCTVGFLVTGILAVISRTSIGKKALNELKLLHRSANDALMIAEGNLKEATNKLNVALEEFDEYKANKEKEIADIKMAYKDDLDKANAKIDKIVEALRNVNNVKVQSLIGDILDEKVNSGSKEEKIQ